NPGTVHGSTRSAPGQAVPQRKGGTRPLRLVARPVHGRTGRKPPKPLPRKRGPESRRPPEHDPTLRHLQAALAGGAGKGERAQLQFYRELGEICFHYFTDDAGTREAEHVLKAACKLGELLADKDGASETDRRNYVLCLSFYGHLAARRLQQPGVAATALREAR